MAACDRRFVAEGRNHLTAENYSLLIVVVVVKRSLQLCGI
jgi:hypothetical protein